MTEHKRQWIAALLLTAGVFLAAARVLGEDAHPGGTPAAADTPASRPGAETRPVRPGPGSEIEDKTIASSGSGGMWASVLRTVLALAVVAALIFGLRFLLRRFGTGRHGRGTSAPISVLGRTCVSARQQVLLIRVGRRLVLVGSGPEGMTPLTEIRDADEVAELVRLAEGGCEQTAVEAAGDARPPAAGQEDRP